MDEYIKDLAGKFVAELEELEQRKGLVSLLMTSDNELRIETQELMEQIKGLKNRLQGLL